MYPQADSPAGRRFYAALTEGRGLKAAARIAGIGKETAFRFLREAFVALRDEGLTSEQAQQRLGFTSSLMPAWDAARSQRGDGRHHRRHQAGVEEVFWTTFNAGAGLNSAAAAAGVSRSTSYRWLAARYTQLREQGIPARAATTRLRLSTHQSRVWEAQHQHAQRAEAARRRHEQRTAIAAAAATVQHLRQPPGVKTRTKVQRRTSARHEQYWVLMRQGLTNTAACKILGVSRKTGTRIRTQGAHQTIPRAPASTLSSAPPKAPGRYLQLHERLLIADLLTIGQSVRAIAAHLGRAPSTISRELRRHRDPHGRYLPHSADHTAAHQRRRTRPAKLAADPQLRRVVQRKLNRCWSPEQIAGWLRISHPHDPQRRVSMESIYRALLVPGAQVLHRRYAARLRTGRALRRSRFLTQTGSGRAVQNMTMIDQRPAAVEARVQPGHWEGDLIIGLGSTSAMITLRERVTHYGLIINLPHDHTSTTVTAALVQAFQAMPASLSRTLTWDQGTEMAGHRAFTLTTGVPVYFAEARSPWQRGANENFNGLVRQYFPKGTDLSIHSAEHVAAVTRELNTRPRKSLDYQTPAVRYRQASRDA